MSGNYIGILFWACMFGLAMKNIGSDTTKKFLADTADAVSQVVRWIINLAPFGIMGLVYTNVAGNGLAIFTQYGKLLALLVGTKLGFNADDPYFASIIGKTITQITFYAADGVYVLPVSVAL